MGRVWCCAFMGECCGGVHMWQECQMWRGGHAQRYTEGIRLGWCRGYRTLGRCTRGDGGAIEGNAGPHSPHTNNYSRSVDSGVDEETQNTQMGSEDASSQQRGEQVWHAWLGSAETVSQKVSETPCQAGQGRAGQGRPCSTVGSAWSTGPPTGTGQSGLYRLPDTTVAQ